MPGSTFCCSVRPSLPPHLVLCVVRVVLVWMVLHRQLAVRLLELRLRGSRLDAQHVWRRWRTRMRRTAGQTLSKGARALSRPSKQRHAAGLVGSHAQARHVVPHGAGGSAPVSKLEPSPASRSPALGRQGPGRGFLCVGQPRWMPSTRLHRAEHRETPQSAPPVRAHALRHLSEQPERSTAPPKTLPCSTQPQRTIQLRVLDHGWHRSCGCGRSLIDSSIRGFVRGFDSKSSTTIRVCLSACRGRGKGGHFFDRHRW